MSTFWGDRMDSFVQMERTDIAEEPSLFLLRNWMNQNVRLTAGFSGKEGGVSHSPWSSLNTGLHVGDAHEHVIANRRRIAEAIGWSFEAWTCAMQVHSNRVAQVNAEDIGRGRNELEDVIGDCDALVTNVPGALLVSFYADCVPLYFYSPEQGAIALAHSGWRGTVGEIAVETINTLKAAYGVKPDRVLAAIGPSIGSCCYEVGGAVIGEVKQLLMRLGLEEKVEQRCMRLMDNGKAHLNLKEINYQLMLKAGILPSHIEMSNWCTGCRTDLFFSHRTEGGSTGRMASWIGIRER